MSEGPTMRRRQLGDELRRLREAVGLTMEQVAAQVDSSRSTISRIETGAGSVRIPTLQAMLRLYEVDLTDQQPLIDLARGARQKGWWQVYRPPARFDTYLGLESAATSLQVYEMNLVHGLLQTPDYARVLFRAVRFQDRVEDIDRLVDLRLARQECLTGKEPLQLWAIFEQDVLERPVGGPEVLRAQLERLLELTACPNITIQVLPRSRGTHVGLDGSFAMLSFGSEGHDVVYLEGMAGNIYLEQPADTELATLKLDHLRAAALSIEESVAAIEAAARELGSST